MLRYAPLLCWGAICHLLRHCGDEAQRFDVCRCKHEMETFGNRVSPKVQRISGVRSGFISSLWMCQCLDSHLVEFLMFFFFFRGHRLSQAWVPTRAPNAECHAHHLAFPADESPVTWCMTRVGYPWLGPFGDSHELQIQVFLPADRHPSLPGCLRWRILRGAVAWTHGPCGRLRKSGKQYS